MRQDEKARLDAILYDWHNTALLSRQNEDIGFWTRTFAGRASVAVLGAGTGRVAIPLATTVGHVWAVDISAERLRRISSMPNLERLVGDFRSVRLPTLSQVALFPYSALQLVEAPGDLRASLANALANVV